MVILIHGWYQNRVSIFLTWYGRKRQTKWTMRQQLFSNFKTGIYHETCSLRRSRWFAYCKADTGVYSRQDERLLLAGNYKNARDALKEMADSPVELIFLDINIPGAEWFSSFKTMTKYTLLFLHLLQGICTGRIWNQCCFNSLKPVSRTVLLSVNKAVNSAASAGQNSRQ